MRPRIAEPQTATVHIRLLAVGDRQPDWVERAFSNYAERLPRNWRFAVQTIPTARRSKRGDAERAVSTEAERLLALIPDGEQVVLLDERGSQFTSTELARKLAGWQAGGRDLAFVIGGPDGVSKSLVERADVVWSLSKLTLPHGLARVLVAEQLYRAWALTAGHPYHRD